MLGCLRPSSLHLIFYSDISFIDTAAQVATILGFFYVIPTSLKVYSVTTASTIAKDILESLPEFNKTIVDFIECPDRSVDSLREQTTRSYEKLYQRICLLENYKELGQVKGSISESIKLLKSHEKDVRDVRKEIAEREFGEDWRNIDKSSKIIETKTILINPLNKIFINPKIPWVKNIVIFSFVTIVVYFFKLYYYVR